MTEQELRALVREAIARHTGETSAAPQPDAFRLHSSHAVFPLSRGGRRWRLRDRAVGPLQPLWLLRVVWTLTRIWSSFGYLVVNVQLAVDDPINGGPPDEQTIK
jgi:hypothetical protein